MLGWEHLRSPRRCLSTALSGIALATVAEHGTVKSTCQGWLKMHPGLGDARCRPEEGRQDLITETLALDGTVWGHSLVLFAPVAARGTWTAE